MTGTKKLPAREISGPCADGEGVEKDEEKADFWRMKAAQNGFKIAIKELENPDKDPEELA